MSGIPAYPRPTLPLAEDFALLGYNAGRVVRVTADDIPSLASGAVDASAQISAALAPIVTDLSAIEGQLGDAQAIRDSAYSAENAELAAQAAALSALISQALNFPTDFVESSRYWTGGNGQISPPTTAANNPVAGTFDNGFYQSPVNPESCYSLGPIGYIVGIPGTQITISARFRALSDVSNGSNPSNTGVGILPLKPDFSLVEFIDGAGAGAVSVAEGWQTVTFTYTVPATTDPLYGAYYRPTFFMNVVGSANPLTPSTDRQGNQQFELSWLETVVTPPGRNAGATAQSGMPSTKHLITATGAGTYHKPAAAIALRLRMKAGAGGGAGGGTNATDGADGSPTSFGAFSCSAGKAGHVGDAPNYARGGAAGASSGTAPDVAFASAPGGNGSNGYANGPGADGGGPRGGKGGGIDPGQSGPAGSGCGGAGGSSSGGGSPGGGGGEAGEIEVLITNPADSYDYSIGDGGPGGTKGMEQYATAGGKGGSGYILVEEIY